MPAIPDSAPDYERSDANISLIAALGAGLAALLVGAPLALRMIYPESIDAPDLKPPLIAAGPKLQIDPEADLARFRHGQEQRLADYGYADAFRQAVHIPIDRAMTLVVERGLPGWSR